MKAICNSILLTLLMSPLTALAQAEIISPDVRGTITFGIKGGTNYSNVYDSEGEQFDADAKFGFAGGGFVSLPIGKLIGIQPEVLYSQKGFQGSGILLGEQYVIDRTTNYLDVPVFFLVKPVPILTLMAGPQFSYLLSQKDVLSDGTNSVEQEQEFENDDIRKNTLCFVSGLDINVRHFVIGGRAGWDLFNNNGDGTSTTPRYKNVWVQATLAYRFY
ncbi:MAG TPA: porin family protein [Fluviicola sp.]|nr:porin family protein [Fluviicola sp.]